MSESSLNNLHICLFLNLSFQESVTFDPFTSISVPLPKRAAVDTIVTHRNDEKSPTKVRSFLREMIVWTNSIDLVSNHHVRRWIHQ